MTKAASDLPKDLRRVLWFSVALTEIGYGEGTVIPDTILNDLMANTVGTNPNQLSSFRKALRSTGTFSVHPEETRGRHTNYYIHHGPPDHMLDQLPKDAHPTPPGGDGP